MRTLSAKNLPASLRRASMFLHGLSGSGKTTRALQGGKPLVIVTEPKAEAHVLNHNPDATAWAPESIKDLERILEWLGSPKLQEQGFTRIVLDSYSDLTQLLPDWCIAHTDPAAAAVIARKVEIQEFNDVQAWALAVVKAIQATGLPSIIIARSEAQKQGRVERIVPSGLGKSVTKLPGMLLPTVEARIDSTAGFIWDMTPDEYSQRCGLPWLPLTWQATADEFLALVERGPSSAASTTEEVRHEARGGNAAPLPAASVNPGTLTAPTPPTVQTVQVTPPAPAPLPETRAEGIAAQAKERREEATAKPVSTKAENFVDEVAAGKASPTFITNEEWGEIERLVAETKIPKDPLLAYLLHRQGLVPTGAGELRLDRITPAAFAKVMPQLRDPDKRRAFVAHIASAYPTTK